VSSFSSVSSESILSSESLVSSESSQLSSSSSESCGVAVQSVNLCGNKIVTKLTGPSSNNGSFQLQVLNSADPSTLVVIFSATRTPGTYTDPFNTSGLTAGVAYDTVEAVYVCGGVNHVDDFSYKFKILGVYRHSQYNTPHESDTTCQSGGTKSVCITDTNCNYSSGSLYSKFESQTALNGSGYSNNYGLIKPEAYCPSHGHPPPTFCLGLSVFRKNQTLKPACSGLSLSNFTVARKASNPDLGCGDKVCLMGAGSGGANILKTVTDLCPGCSLTQLDNYTTNGACTGIPDLGNFNTVKVP
jgi:hypothetical protein